MNNNMNNMQNMQQNGVRYNAPMNNMGYNQYNQYNNEVPGSTSILVMGILSLSLCWLFGIGLIFSIIGMVKASNYARVAPLTGKAKVGKILSIVGLPVNIVLILIYVIAIIVAAEEIHYYRYWWGY